MNEELTLAIDEIRQHNRTRSWFIPILVTECDIPDISISSSETLSDFQAISFQHRSKEELQQLRELIYNDEMEEAIYKKIINKHLKRLGRPICLDCKERYSLENIYICSHCECHYCIDCIWQFNELPKRGSLRIWRCRCGGKLS